MAMASVDDSDIDEPFSPEIKPIDGQVLPEGMTTSTYALPSRTYSATYADEFGIAPASPTRQHLRRSQSTTMDKLRNKTDAYGQSTTLEDIARRRPRQKEDPKLGSINDVQTTEGSTIGMPAASFLSRDGDAMTCSGISMSTPDFTVVETMPPPTSVRQSSSGNATAILTQPLSEYENPLHVLIQPQVSDGLPSTKPSSENLTLNTLEKQESTSGTQDDLAAAAQIGDDLLANMLDPHFAETGIFAGHRQSDSSQDELATNPATLQKPVKANKLSSKRKRSVMEEEAGGAKLSKKTHTNTDPSDDDLFGGLPVENYQPRKSRSRAARPDTNESSDIDISRRSEAKKKHKISRRKTTGGAVIIDAEDDEDAFEEIEQQLFVPAKSRSRKTKKTVESGALEEITRASEAEELSRPCTQSSNTTDAIVVVTARELPEEINPVNVKQKNSKKTRKQSKTSTGKQKAIEDNDESTTYDTVRHSAKSGSQKTGSVDNSNALEVNQIPLPTSTGDANVEEHDTVRNEEEELDQTNSRTVSQNDAMANRTDEHSKEKGEQLPEVKKTKTRGRKRAGSKKSGPQIVTSATSPPSTPILDLEIETVAEQVATANGSIVNETANEEQPLQEVKAQASSDKTNLAPNEKQITPEKPEKTTTIHSPLKNARVPYRVGLSRRSRIEPLLKTIRKEKDTPKDSVSKKKNKT